MRQFVFEITATRVIDITALVTDLAFQRLDHRLAAYLLQRARDGIDLELTHGAIASDLGTAREVVSRLLKSFEARGALQLGRGRITLVDPAPLRELAS